MEKLDSYTYKTNSTELTTKASAGQLRPGAVYIVSDLNTICIATDEQTYVDDLDNKTSINQEGSGVTNTLEGSLVVENGIKADSGLLVGRYLLEGSETPVETAFQSDLGTITISDSYADIAAGSFFANYVQTSADYIWTAGINSSLDISCAEEGGNMIAPAGRFMVSRESNDGAGNVRSMIGVVAEVKQDAGLTASTTNLLGGEFIVTLIEGDVTTASGNTLTLDIGTSFGAGITLDSVTGEQINLTLGRSSGNAANVTNATLLELIGTLGNTASVTNAYGIYQKGVEFTNILEGPLELENILTINEASIDPPDPAEGKTSVWMSDGTGAGDDGDIMLKITAGGVTKTITLVDFSSAP